MKITITASADISSIFMTSCSDCGCGGHKDSISWDRVFVDYNWYDDGIKNEFFISKPEELAGFARIVNGTADGIAQSSFNGKTITLAANIDLNNKSWKPIGIYDDSKSLQKSFTGTFDGNGYIITNLYIDATNNESQGIFGHVGMDGMVKNVSINADIAGVNYVGAVVGYNCGGTVQNCYSTGKISGKIFVGGVVGCNQGTIQNCYSTCCILDGVSAGGVVGENRSGTVRNCYSTRKVYGNKYVGGVVGENTGKGMVQNCVALNSSITRSSGSDSAFGRVAGMNNDATFTNNYGRSDMEFIDISYSLSSNLNNKDGADITADNWNSADWWQNTAKFSPDVWDFIKGLPMLKNVGGDQNPTVKE